MSDEVDIVDALIDERDWYDERLTTVEAENAILKNVVKSTEVEAKGRIALARQTCVAQEHKIGDLEVENKRLREALQHIADGCRLVCEPSGEYSTVFEEEAFRAIQDTIDEADAALTPDTKQEG